VSGYNACLQAEVQDEYDSLGDAQSFLIETMRELQIEVIQKMDTIVISNRQVHFFTDSLFSHFKNHHPADDKYLRVFEPLLLTLARDRECAEQIERGLEENEIPRQYIPRLLTKVLFFSVRESAVSMKVMPFVW
jgi:hypothetical protein